MDSVLLDNTHKDCTGCMLCSDMCPTGAIKVNTDMLHCEVFIDDNKCIDCMLCKNICPQNKLPYLKKPIKWYQGWSRDRDTRLSSSSGGLASEIAKNFINNGGEVCTCKFDEGKFGFEFFDDPIFEKKAAGSKYVKSNPQGIYKELLNKLKQGKKILLIALPCQIAAAINCAGQYADNLYTIDLICHGTPSPDTLEAYLCEKGINLKNIDNIYFRKKTDFNVFNNDMIIEKYFIDPYTYLFLKSIIYTENCYRCRYARIERVSDITLGDSWGSELPKEQTEEGISLILCQTNKGLELLKMSDLELFSVDIEKAIAANKQLVKPSEIPDCREKFFKLLKSKGSFQKAFIYTAPIRNLKNLLMKYIIRRPRGGALKMINYGITIIQEYNLHTN